MHAPVTRANQGLGFQVAKQLVASGLTALVGSRNLERGQAAEEEIGPGATEVQLGVTDRVSIAEASPNRINFDKHSCLMERTHRSANGFKSGLRGGSRMGWIVAGQCEGLGTYGGRTLEIVRILSTSLFGDRQHSSPAK